MDPDRPQPPHILEEQAILNWHWPPHPREIRRHDPIPVRVCIVWERDGAEWIPGVARRWDAGHVYVEITDTRSATTGVWVKPEDVYRQRPD